MNCSFASSRALSRKGSALISCVVLMCLASCGGGDSGSAPPQSNSAPRFTSAESATVRENTTSQFYTATASDPEGDTVTFRIAGGPDSGLFSIANNGALSFRSAPDFENPADADGDNVYEVELQASDGRASVNLSLVVEVTNTADAARLTRIATGLGPVVAMSPTADSELLIVANAAGHVVEIAVANGSVTDIGRIFENDLRATDYRVVTLAPSGDYSEDKEVFALFLGYGGNLVIDRYIRSGTIWFSNTAGLAAEAIDEAIAAELVATSVQAPDGSVYFLTGDGGQPERAQQDGIVGNIVRAYRNPDPFAGASVRYFLAQTVGRGLHAPTGGSFVEDILLFSDSGDTRYDEINRFDPGGNGSNFGWPFREGRMEMRSGASGGLIDPVLVFDRGTGSDADAPIVAGAYYEGPIPGLHEKFVYATQDGRFFTVDPDDLRAGAQSSREQSREITNEFQTDAGELDRIVSLRFAGGTLFVLDSDGEVYRVDLEQI